MICLPTPSTMIKPAKLMPIIIDDHTVYPNKSVNPNAKVVFKAVDDDMNPVAAKFVITYDG